MRRIFLFFLVVLVCLPRDWYFKARTAWQKKRGTYKEVTLADFSAAMDEAARKFPNDKFHLEAKAMSELYMRELFGKRKHDA